MSFFPTTDIMIQSLNRDSTSAVNKAVEMFGTGKIKAKDKAFAKKTLKDLLKGGSMKRKYKSQTSKKSASQRGKKLASSQKKKAAAQLRGETAKWKKFTTNWFKKPRKNVKKTSKKTGRKYTHTVYFQFLNAVRKAGGTNRLGQLIYKKYGPAKGDYATATKKTAKTFKKMTAAAIKKKAAAYQKSKAKGKYGKLLKQVGKENASKVVAASRKIRGDKTPAKTTKTFKKMTAAAIKKKAATYQKSKVRGKYFNLKKQVGEANAKKVSAEAKKIRAKSQKKK